MTLFVLAVTFIGIVYIARQWGYDDGWAEGWRNGYDLGADAMLERWQASIDDLTDTLNNDGDADDDS